MIVLKTKDKIEMLNHIVCISSYIKNNTPGIYYVLHQNRQIFGEIKLMFDTEHISTLRGEKLR